MTKFDAVRDGLCNALVMLIAHVSISIWLLTLAFFTGTPALHAQLPERLYFNHITPHEGLAQSAVASIYKDHYGFMWFSSYDGISRFDGVECRSNSEIAPGWNIHNQYMRICGDEQYIYMGSNLALKRFNIAANRFEDVLVHKDGSNKPTARQVVGTPLAVRAGQVLIDEHKGKYSIINTDTGMEVDSVVAHSPDGRITHDLSGRPAALFAGITLRFGHLNDGVSFAYIRQNEAGKVAIHYKRLIIEQSAPVGQYAKFTSSDTHIYFALRNVGVKSENIYRYNLETDALETFLEPGLEIYGIYAHGDYLFCGYLTKFEVYDVNTGSLVNTYRYDMFDAQGMLAGPVTNIHITPDEMIWIVNWGRGVSYASIKPNLLSHHFADPEATRLGVSNFVRGIVRGADNNYYCNAYGLVVLDEKFRFKRKISDIESQTIHASGPYIYFGSGMLMRYDVFNREIEKVNLGAYEDSVASNPTFADYYSMQSMQDGRILLGARVGAYVYDPPSGKYVKVAVPGNFHTSIFAAADLNDGMYLTNQFDKLHYAANGCNSTKPNFQPLPITLPKCLWQQNDTTVWIGSTSGLHHFNPITAQVKLTYTTSQGLPNNVVYAILPDRTGKLWLSTNRGLARFNPATAEITPVPGNGKLHNVEYNTNSATTTPEGALVFGGTRGITVVNYDRQEESLPRLPLVFSSASISDSIPAYLISGSQITYQPGVKSINLRGVVPIFNNPELFRIRYRFEESERWVTGENPAIASLINLQPGTYHFQANAGIIDAWSNEIFKLELVVLPFWWQTLAFRLASFLVAVLLIFFTARWYTQMKWREKALILQGEIEINRERERITADLHDDVGATLSSMYLYSDLASQNWDAKPDTSRDLLGRVNVQSKDLMVRMSDIIWSLKPTNDSSQTFGSRLKNHCHDILSAKNIKVEYELNDALNLMLINPMVRKNLLLIAKEAINNIAKYSEASTVYIRLFVEAKSLHFEIMDDGKGFDITTNTGGNGLGHIHRRCTAMNGLAEISSSPGGGCAIRCAIPMAIIGHVAA